MGKWTHPELSPVARGHSTDTQLSDVTVGYRDYSISFEYTALDYTSSDKNQYRYILEGFDEDWLDSGRFRRATYTNLPAGQYTFKVKASNNDGVWSQGSAAIDLRVTPPPWKTGWAYVSYFLLVLSVGLEPVYRKKGPEWFTIRKFIGRTGMMMIILHIIMSFLLFSPEVYSKFY